MNRHYCCKKIHPNQYHHLENKDSREPIILLHTKGIRDQKINIKREK